VLAALGEVFPPGAPRRLFDLGCGNGSVAAELSARVYDVTGADLSRQAIAMARTHRPRLKLHQKWAHDDLAAEFGRFPVVLKNLALAITGRLAPHFDTLTDSGHIKFFLITRQPQLNRVHFETRSPAVSGEGFASGAWSRGGTVGSEVDAV